MAKVPLTPQQKLAEKKKKNLKFLHNNLLSSHNFGQVKTWKDVYKVLGRQFEGEDRPVTYQELRTFCDLQMHDLEEQLATEQQEKESHEKAVATTEAIISKVETVPTEERNTVIQDTSNPVITTPTRTEEKIVKTDDAELNKDYGLHKSPNETAFHYWFQKKAIKELWDKIVQQKRRGVLLLAGTGMGKTFMTGGFVRRLEDIMFSEGKTWSHIPYLYVTRATVVEQTERVLKNFYKLTAEHIEVINIEQLRSKAGRLWVQEKKRFVNGEEEFYWEWKKNINPCVILWDECQSLKNSTSSQHKIAAAYNDLPSDETYQVFISATPFTRVSEAKCFAVSTHHDISHLGFPQGTTLNNSNWSTYAAAIASPAKPDDYNEAAVDRLMDDLKDYVVRVKGVRPQFEAENSIQMISFQSKEEREYYEKAYDRYLEEKAKLEAKAMAEGNLNGSGGIGILVEFLKFRMAAEFCRRHWFAKEMYNIVQSGKAAAVAVNFKATIIAVVQILVNDYNVSRDQISLVWGGGQTGLTKKQKMKQQVKERAAKLEAMGMSVDEMLEDLGLDEVEDRIIEELDPSLRLGAQSPEDRQREIDRFQSGKSIYCMFTFRAGGVGLSLHHTDELVKQKVRRKESGYAVEEDIPNIPVRPREGLVAPTYSAIELVQGLGRLPRLTSLSPTRQRLVFYAGTIEQDVAHIVSRKLKCLTRVVRNKEKWEDVIIDSKNRSQRVKEHIDAVPPEDSGEDNGGLLDGTTEEGDE